VDKKARFRKMASVFEKRTFYGQLLRVVVIDVPASPLLKTSRAETVLLAIVRSIKAERCSSNNTTFYKNLGSIYAIDLNTVECVVGRVHDRNRWTIVDRAPNSDHAP
jgi:hypothetical protein